MRRWWFAVAISFTLVACGSSSRQAVVVCDQQFWNGVFGTCLPTGWKVLGQETLKSLGVPEETVAAFQLTEPTGGQFDTVAVTTEQLSQPMETTDYVKANILAVSALPEYKLLDKRTMQIDGKESAIHIFSARPVPDQPVRRYEQLSAVNGSTGYTFTASFPLSVSEAESNQATFILQNVTFVNPATASK